MDGSHMDEPLYRQEPTGPRNGISLYCSTHGTYEEGWGTYSDYRSLHLVCSLVCASITDIRRYCMLVQRVHWKCDVCTVCEGMYMYNV